MPDINGPGPDRGGRPVDRNPQDCPVCDRGELEPSVQFAETAQCVECLLTFPIVWDPLGTDEGYEWSWARTGDEPIEVEPAEPDLMGRDYREQSIGYRESMTDAGRGHLL